MLVSKAGECKPASLFTGSECARSPASACSTSVVWSTLHTWQIDKCFEHLLMDLTSKIGVIYRMLHMILLVRTNYCTNYCHEVSYVVLHSIGQKTFLLFNFLPNNLVIFGWTWRRDSLIFKETRYSIFFVWSQLLSLHYGLQCHSPDFHRSIFFGNILHFIFPNIGQIHNLVK